MQDLFQETNLNRPPSGLTAYFILVVILTIMDFIPGARTIVLFLSFLLPLCIILLGIALDRGGSKPKNKTVVAETEIMKEFSPCQLGLIQNHGSFTKECFTAIIASLYVKKVIHFEKMENGDILMLLDKDPDNKLPVEEREFLDIAFVVAKKNNAVRMSSVNGNFRSLKFIEYLTNSYLTREGIFNKNSLLTKRLFNIIKLFSFSSAIIILIINCGMLFAEDKNGAIQFGITNILVFSFGLILTSAFAHIIAKHVISLSPKGLEIKRRVQGLLEYMRVAEKDRVKFMENQFLRYEIIPYAIALGEKSLWKRLFAEIKFDNSFYEFISGKDKGGSSMETYISDLEFEFSKIVSELLYTVRPN